MNSLNSEGDEPRISWRQTSGLTFAESRVVTDSRSLPPTGEFRAETRSIS